MSRRRCWVRLLGGVVTLNMIALVSLGLASGIAGVDLRTDAAVSFSGSLTLGPVGDVNGDGSRDAAISAGCYGTTLPALTVIVFGPLQQGEFDVRADDVAGFRIEGDSSGQGACLLSSSMVGDINGDGLDDVVIGAHFTGHLGRTWNGTLYVVFGKSDEETVFLSDFDARSQGDAGYVIEGAYSTSLIGQDFSGVGDVNHDGLADLVVGSVAYGTTYVVFGKSDTESIDLRSFEEGTHGDAGYLIRTRGADRGNGYAVAGAGDVNADGTPDVVIGSVGDVNDSVGRAYVVFGKADSSPVDARRLKGTGLGFKIKTLYGGDSGGKAVSGAGDVNGDGRDDVLVGVPRDTTFGRGLAFVVFGKGRSRPVKLAELGDGGFRIRGQHRRDAAGRALATAGDVDGDGLSDVLVGAHRGEVEGRGTTGIGYLVYGKTDSDPVRLRNLDPSQGVRIIGREHAELTGWTVAGPGDMNGDGIPDIMIGGGGGGFYADIVWGLSWEN